MFFIRASSIVGNFNGPFMNLLFCSVHAVHDAAIFNSLQLSQK